MERLPANQQLLRIGCFTIENQDNKLGPAQHSIKLAPSSPPQRIRNGVADAGQTDTHLAPPDQAKTQLSEESHSHESGRNIPEPELCSSEHSQQVRTNELVHQTTSPEPSVHTQSDHRDLSAAVTPTSSGSDMTPSNATMQYPRRLRMSESLGLEGCVSIIGGFVAILGIFGFLPFLWFGSGSAPEAANATWIWRQLALRNWMPRVVTLSSIIIQFIITTQTTICTSMIAALLLERVSVPRSQVASASIMRGINDGPWKLVMLVLSCTSKASYVLWHLEAWLIILVALLSLALQFTSTILLSDMHSFVMLGDNNITTANSLFAFPGEDKFELFQGRLTDNVPIYPVFGEVPMIHDSSPDKRGFSDTGLTQRGFLPMPDSDVRTSVRDYDGMGMVMSSRVACMRPVFSNIFLDLEYGRSGGLQGVLDYDQSLQEARPSTGPLCNSSEDCARVSFDCSIPAALNTTDTWAAGGCIIDGVGGHFRGRRQPTWDPESGPWSQNSSVWLVYSTDMGEDQWASLPSSSSMPLGQPSGEGEWTIYEILPGYFIKVAVCFSAFNFAYRDIRMTASGATRERSTPWSLVLNENSNIEGIEMYLGLIPWRQSMADRGILELQIKPDNSTARDTPYTPPPPFDDLLRLSADEISPSALTVDSIQLQMNYELSNANTRSTTFMLCQHCTIQANTVHMEYAFLFSSILLGKVPGAGRAADALHAFINVAGFNVYDQFLADSMDVTEQVRIVTTHVVTVPGSWPPKVAQCVGLITVATLLAAYLCLVLGITVLYVRHTRYSRYANVWHVISQLVASKELEETFEWGNDASDDAVVEGLKMNVSCKEDIPVKLGKPDGSEKIEVRRCTT